MNPSKHMKMICRRLSGIGQSFWGKASHRKMAAVLAMLFVSPAWCDINGGSALKNFLKTLFSALMFAGIVLIIAGAASLIRTIVSVASGEQAQPGAIGRGLGLLIGGIVLAGLKAIITAVIGQDPTSINFLG